MAPKDQAPPHTQADSKAASGGPRGAGHPTFAEIAEQLLDEGYAPIPIKPGRKAPAVSRWSDGTIDETQVAKWIRAFPDHGVGLRTGHLVGLDIDILDPELSWQVADLAQERFGETLLRVGLWPKRLLLYRIDAPIPKIDVKPIEVLGQGQQLVAFGVHEDTGKPYTWPLGETPLDVPLSDLPLVDRDGLMDFVAEARAIVPDMGQPSGNRRRGGVGGGQAGPVRNDAGLVIDGRDAWLSSIAFHAVHDAVEREDEIATDVLAELAWGSFEETTDLSRPRQDGGRCYALVDARRKVADKLRLHRQNRLPPRQRVDVDAAYTPPTATVSEAREALDVAIDTFCTCVLGHYDPLEFKPRPCIGIRATVGLGKSSIARQHLVDLRRRLHKMDAPSRIVVLTPSHDLADETAAAWEDHGERVAVLRGYHREHPTLKAHMCRDREAIDAAIAAGVDPQSAVCASKDGARCPFFHGCLKQQNRDEVQGADIVVAPYDALYTGFAVDPDSIGLIVIDEGCWARAVRRTEGLTLEGLTTDLVGGLGTGMFRNRGAGQTADRMALRQMLQCALSANGPGPVTKATLRKAGLTADACNEAAILEERLLKDPKLRPGLTGLARKAAFGAARRNERARHLTRLWRTARDILAGSEETTGRLRVLEPRDDGIRRLAVVDLAGLHLNFRDKPILHLDATLRPEIATALLPNLELTEVAATAPHMNLRLISGSFGKSAIVPDERAGHAEAKRRRKNLADCVDHVRWHARRMAPGRVLVITNMAIEDAFAAIPGVETAHFNAIAGLDAYRDVAALFVIGRPLPRDTDLLDPCAALLRSAPDGSYTGQLCGVRMRDGSSRSVRAIRHTGEKAEILRAAICDDELIQAIGRGRGVNRTAETPLEVHLMADVALPLVHDSVVAWETLKPDVVQRMLLAGIAVDSPADAAVLHPELLGNANAAKLTFKRIGFKGQIPISTYRGMTLKSAAYRRHGRGRSRQHVYWLDGDDDSVRYQLEQAIGALAEWQPSR